MSRKRRPNHSPASDPLTRRRLLQTSTLALVGATLLYLHYVFDLWVDVWRRKCARGEVVVIRYADGNVLGFQYCADADRFLDDFRERLGKFGLELHPEAQNDRQTDARKAV